MRDGLRARFPQSAVTVGFTAKNGSGTLGVSAAVLLVLGGTGVQGGPACETTCLDLSPRWPSRSLSQPLPPTKLLHAPRCAPQARGPLRMHVCARPQHPPVGQQEPGTCSPSSLWRGGVQGTDATSWAPSGNAHTPAMSEEGHKPGICLGRSETRYTGSRTRGGNKQMQKFILDVRACFINIIFPLIQ